MEAIAVKQLDISSTAFTHEGEIPELYTCRGSNINPPLQIRNIPTETITLALIIEDPDAPGRVFNHWLVWNIPPSHTIYQHSVPGLEGKNSSGAIGYKGPCPPSGKHRYFFKVYALDTLLDLAEGADKAALQNAMKDHVVGYGEMMGVCVAK